jgi:2-dehydropantoate 2-reductase
MNIAIIGIGGVGGYFGGKLTRLLEIERGINVYFIARNEHLEAIKRNGLLLDSDEGRFICKPTAAISDISQLPPLDFCLVCVKGYDLKKALIQLKPKISANTMVLPLLNGVDIYERIRLVIQNGVVFPSSVYVATHIEKPGQVT